MTIDLRRSTHGELALANPSKTQVCAFHLRNREAKRELNVEWNSTRLSNTTTPVYLGVHLDAHREDKDEGEREK